MPDLFFYLRVVHLTTPDPSDSIRPGPDGIVAVNITTVGVAF